MGVCRGWRLAVCPLFYSTALLDLGGTTSAEAKDVFRVMSMADAMDNGCQHYVKDVYMAINVYTFNEDWGGVLTDPVSVLRGCGQLSAVRSCTIRIWPHDTPALRDGDKETKTVGWCSRRIANNIDAFVASLAATMPNMRRVAIHTTTLYAQQPAQSRIVEQVYGCLHRLIGAQITHASLSHIGDGLGVTTVSEATALQSIILSHLDFMPHHVELVRRNFQSLERLHIYQLKHDTAVQMVLGGDDHEQALIYPRLKHLYIGSCLEANRPAAALPMIDPFPRLKVLVYRGDFLLGLQVLRGESRAHLNHLAIDINSAIFDALFSHAGDRAGGFPGLGYVSL
ncbi:hypothetical protein LPJ61_006116, partial [Coemansia biformis]